jgi:hypothetical protein
MRKGIKRRKCKEVEEKKRRKGRRR